MINGIIESIENTKIFSSIVYPAVVEIRDKKRVKIPEGNPLQMIIYSTKITFQQKNDELGSIQSNMLILPFPLVSGANRFKILNMAQYANFFEDVEMIFPTVDDDTFKGSLYRNLEVDDKIEYDNSYNIIIAKNYQILESRMDISFDLKEFAKRYYSNNFGFILINIKSNKPLAPFAYVHEIRDSKMFIPLKCFYKTSYTKSFSKSEDPHANSDEMQEIEVNSFIYRTLMVDDEWLRMAAKKKDIKSFKEQHIIWDHELYIVNFPRITRNPLLKKPGIKIFNGDIGRLNDFYTYIENPKLPLDIVLIKPKYLFKVSIDGGHKYNYDMFL